MALALVTICNSIAALDVEGVTIKSVDQIPPDCTRLYPVLFPEPVNFVTNFTTDRNTFGADSGGFRTVEYDLNYTFLFMPIGAGRTGLDYYDKMLTKVALIVDEILANDTIDGAWDIKTQGTVDFGPVPDPAGNQYLGCRLVFHVIEQM